MNKLGMVLGVAAVATLAGCKDPDYKYANGSAQDEVKNIDTTVQVEPAPSKCMCLPGTKHTAPCGCGSFDCKCIVEQPIVITTDLSKPVSTPVATTPVAPVVPAAAATTTYIVQRGDSLSKISKKFNITLSALRKANPKVKKDVIMVGQKLILPAKVEVGPQTVPEGAIAKPAKKVYSAYTGATKEYVVKSGDNLGVIAYSNGINIRQLKELNGLKKDTVRVGQKLKIPAEKVVVAKTVAKKADKVAVAAADKAVATKVAAVEKAAADKDAAPVAAPDAAAPAVAPEAAKQAEETIKQAEEAAPASATYVVQEGDDMTGVSIRWGVSAASIRELNNLSDDAQLVPGQILKLPADAQQ